MLAYPTGCAVSIVMFTFFVYVCRYVHIFVYVDILQVQFAVVQKVKEIAVGILEIVRRNLH